jgi:hypothetical protein
MQYSPVDITSELIYCGAFSHLPDRELSRLHWIMLQKRDPGSRELTESVIAYWYRGDFYQPGVSQKLLQQCNEFLQSIGQPLIESCCLEYFEA